MPKHKAEPFLEARDRVVDALVEAAESGNVPAAKEILQQANRQERNATLANATPKKTGRPVAGAEDWWHEAFLAELATTCNVTHSAALVGVDRATVYREKKRNPTFADAWREAVAIGVEALKDEVHRRAFQGYEKPVYQGGDLVGFIREFSDTLAIFLLKAHEPETFRESSVVRHEGGIDLMGKLYLFDPEALEPETNRGRGEGDADKEPE